MYVDSIDEGFSLNEAGYGGRRRGIAHPHLLTHQAELMFGVSVYELRYNGNLTEETNHQVNELMRRSLELFESENGICEAISTFSLSELALHLSKYFKTDQIYIRPWKTHLTIGINFLGRSALSREQGAFWHLTERHKVDWFFNLTYPTSAFTNPAQAFASLESILHSEPVENWGQLAGVLIDLLYAGKSCMMQTSTS